MESQPTRSPRNDYQPIVRPNSLYGSAVAQKPVKVPKAQKVPDNSFVNMHMAPERDDDSSFVTFSSFKPSAGSKNKQPHLSSFKPKRKQLASGPPLARSHSTSEARTDLPKAGSTKQPLTHTQSNIVVPSDAALTYAVGLCRGDPQPEEFKVHSEDPNKEGVKVHNDYDLPSLERRKGKLKGDEFANHDYFVLENPAEVGFSNDDDLPTVVPPPITNDDFLASPLDSPRKSDDKKEDYVPFDEYYPRGNGANGDINLVSHVQQKDAIHAPLATANNVKNTTHAEQDPVKEDDVRIYYELENPALWLCILLQYIDAYNACQEMHN